MPKHLRSIFSALSCVVIGLMLMSQANGQRRTITESELDALVTKAAEARKSMSYRVKISSLTVFDSPASQPEVRASSTAEYLPPDRSYLITERQIDTRRVRSESIRIGDERFLKEPTGEWRLLTPQSGAGNGDGTGAGFGSGAGSGSGTAVKVEPPEIKLECEFVGAKEINGTPVDLYQKVRTITFGLANKRMVRIVTKKYWFDKKGLLVREISDEEFANATKSYRTVSEYEYDPTIRIERPRIN